RPRVVAGREPGAELFVFERRLVRVARLVRRRLESGPERPGRDCGRTVARARTAQVATVVERWYGTKWSTVSSPNRGTNDSYLWGVSCVSPSWCAAVGQSFNAGVGGRTLVEMWNGKTWRIVASPSLPNELNQLASV